MSNKITRRDFLKYTGMGGAAALAAATPSCRSSLMILTRHWQMAWRALMAKLTSSLVNGTT